MSSAGDSAACKCYRQGRVGSGNTTITHGRPTHGNVSTDCHRTSVRQLKQIKQLSLPHQDDNKTNKDTKVCITKAGLNSEPHNSMGGTLNHESTWENLFLGFCLIDLILFVHSTIFQLCGTVLPGFNQY